MTRRIHFGALLRLVLIGILAVGCVADVQARSVAAADPAGGFVCKVMDMAADTVDAGDDGAEP